MGGQYFSNAGLFLINTLFGLYILAVMLRFLLQLVHADYKNQVFQILVKVTQPALFPLRRLIPGIGGIDVAAILLMFLLKIAELILIGMLPEYSMPNFPAMLIIATAELLGLCVNVFIFALIIQAIISWVAPSSYNPLTVLLYQLTNPVLTPARRILPPMSGLDLSPMVVIIVLYLLTLLLIHPLTDFGRRMAFYG